MSKAPRVYTDFFKFQLHIPIAVFEGCPNEEIMEMILDMDAIPITFISDKNHSLFKRIQSDFFQQGVTDKIKIIVLAIRYNKPFL